MPTTINGCRQRMNVLNEEIGGLLKRRDISTNQQEIDEINIRLTTMAHIYCNVSVVLGDLEGHNDAPELDYEE
tara:strand:+ start:81 stop:299 length:219 start_codon:yes stop_codon:yes gene_type:complete